MRFHTSLPVTNIEATEAFYRLIFEASPTKRKPDYLKFLTPGLNISFHRTEGAQPLTDVHLGFEVSSPAELNELHQRLAREGIISTPRETSVCCYANQDKFWVTDPSGYRWELYYLVEAAEQKIDPSSQCCAAARSDLDGSA